MRGYFFETFYEKIMSDGRHLIYSVLYYYVLLLYITYTTTIIPLYYNTIQISANMRI